MIVRGKFISVNPRSSAVAVAELVIEYFRRDGAAMGLQWGCTSAAPQRQAKLPDVSNDTFLFDREAKWTRWNASLSTCVKSGKHFNCHQPIIIHFDCPKSRRLDALLREFLEAADLRSEHWHRRNGSGEFYV
jgi:hypothetical protein